MLFFEDQCRTILDSCCRNDDVTLGKALSNRHVSGLLCSRCPKAPARYCNCNKQQKQELTASSHSQHIQRIDSITMAAFPDSSTLEEAAIIVAGLRSNSITDSSLSSASSAAASGSEKRVGDIGDVTFVTAAKSTNNNYSEPPKRAKSSNKKKQQPSQDADGGAPAKKPKAIKPPPMDATGLVFAQPELKPHPFFYYSDHSLEHDDDPLTPITAAGIVPTFPASEFTFGVLG